MRPVKAYIALPPNLAGHRATARVVAALERHAPPNVTVVTEEEGADLVVIHVIGYPETAEAVARARARGQRYAMLQYCLRTTQEPYTAAWRPLWAGAAAVWSYYDLAEAIAEDGEVAGAMPWFYHAPLGVDATAFRRWPTARNRAILTSGYVAETEGVREASEAAGRLGLHTYHLGPDLGLGAHVSCQLGVTDEQLAQSYSRVRYVAGLRRVEGFELPAAEGLLCGARPVVFDRPHYRQWFGDWAEYIPEGTPEQVTDALQALFAGPYRAVSDMEIFEAREAFDWGRLVAGFWALAAPEHRAVSVAPRRRLLWVGDAGVSSGFARATHRTLDVLREDWDVAVLGLNYLGDPHQYPYPIYPCLPVVDPLGQARIKNLIADLRPDVVVLQNDPWNMVGYTKHLPDQGMLAVGIVAVDGKNCRGNLLAGLDLAVFWTEFGRREAHAGGYAGPSAVVPLGVDLSVYRPMDRAWAREAVLGDSVPQDAFLVGNVNRNQPRKRMDLTVQYFCEWIRTRDVRDAYLYMHVAPTQDVGYDIRQLMAYHLRGWQHGKRLVLPYVEERHGVPEAQLAASYAMLDVVLTTTQGEGFGLPALEAMACGTPVIAPDWSGLGDWARPAAMLVPCTTTAATPNNVNAIGGVPDREQTIAALDALYRDRGLRDDYSARGLALASEDRFRWGAIGRRFGAVLEELWAGREALWAARAAEAEAGAEKEARAGGQA